MGMKFMAVHVKTPQEWDAVVNVLGYIFTKRTSKWDQYGSLSCISLKDNKFKYVDWYKRKGYTVLTYNEFMSYMSKTVTTTIPNGSSGIISLETHGVRDEDLITTKKKKSTPNYFNVVED